MAESVCEIDFCYGHRLLNYTGNCRHLHGHNGHAQVFFDPSRLDDSDDHTARITELLEQTLDSRMILNGDDPLLARLQEMGEPIVVFDVNPTAENIAKFIHDSIRNLGMPVTEVRVWETPKSCATYSSS